MMKSCLSQISSLYDKLSYSEHVFADEVLSHPENIVYKSIAELAESLGIATSTIVATTKKLGFTGFKEFKITLAGEMINPTSPSYMNPTVEHTEGDKSIFERTIGSNIAGLEEAMRSISQKNFDDAAGILQTAKRIYIIGIGTSGIIARELHDYLFRLGLDCIISEDHHHQLLVAKRLEAGDAAILISQSGVNKDIILLGQELKAGGASVIGISNFLNTPFAKCCDVLLAPFKTITAFHENNFTMRIPMLGMVETLYYTLSERLYEKYSSSMEANKNVIRSTSITSK